MTQFERLSTELVGKVETDKNGLYSGMTKGIAALVNEAIFDKDLKGMELDQYVKRRFYQLFPYMANNK